VAGLFGGGGDLTRDVELVAHHLHEVERRLDEIDVLLLVLED
jgi:hypothetical protein